MENSPRHPRLTWVIGKRDGIRLYAPIFSELMKAGFHVNTLIYGDEDVGNSGNYSWLEQARNVSPDSLLGGFGPGALLACSLLPRVEASGLFLGYVPREELSGLVELDESPGRVRSWILRLLRKQRPGIPPALRATAAKAVLEGERDLPLLALAEEHRAEGAPILYGLYRGRHKRLARVNAPVSNPGKVAAEFIRHCSLFWPDQDCAALTVETLQHDALEFFAAALERICEFMVSTVNGPCAMASWGGTAYLQGLGYPCRVAAGDPLPDGSEYGHYWTIVSLPDREVAIDWTRNFPVRPRVQSVESMMQEVDSFDPACPRSSRRFFTEVLEWAPASDRWWNGIHAAD